ncbi:MAG: ATP-binding protein [[Clostridium] innocuum]|nr:ATP-binding protein [[Clostridium] innocuum]MCI2997159.1 ATP-binding protein [[Clostridium] innocuum]MCR0547768.1 ATP-binding protein [[Clostridium] innocuum]MCR0589134.1 ATP-binding protein [[Clostridium] innocuum]
MMFPIKYIDNNLVWNKDNEVFAYYELIPYNYSFLSAEQKYIVHDSFRQLIAQSREGKIHALQIATESSVRSIQEQSKKLVSGRLRDVAIQKIDEQTEALVSMIGDNQMDYRFFLGFKLMVTEQEVNLKNMKKSLFMTVKEFLNEVNHTLMNDFVSMTNDEINRYMKMEKLLENKISRRFKVRRLDKNDFGYLMEHLYGRDGVAYEDYEYSLPKKKLKKETLIKYYDLIRPIRCLIEESQRYLRLEHEDSESYVSYLTVNAIVGELDFPSSEIFYFQQQQFIFPVDTSMNVEIVENRKALSVVRNKKKELKDLDNHAFQSGSETSSNVVDALDSVDELETDLDQSKESMYKLSYVIRVSAPDLDELKRRCDEVKDFYDDLNVKLVRPAGDMLGLHSEFLPASKRYINDYVQYVKSDFLASLGFGATQQLGENTGIYIGYSVDTGRNVYLQPSIASQGIKGTVTNALASAFVGSLGGGKSFCNNLLVYYSVLFGGQAVILDPKSERGNWKNTLPEIAHEINIVNLTSEKENAGLLDPFVIMRDVKDAESLAIDILTFLTGISSRDGEKFPVLRKAVRSVVQSDQRGLLHVIKELRKEDTPIARNIADHIDSFTDYDFAHLLFSDGTVENAISLENQLNIIQVADLVLPDKDTTFEEYTTIELLSVSMLIVISTFALDFIHSDRSIFKIVDLDEAWAFLNVAQGETLSNKLVRAGRAMNAGVYFVTQSATDVSKESLRNNIGLKFAFRSTAIEEIKQTLEFFGLDKEDENNQKRLRDLENGQCLFQDLCGRVGVIQVHPVFEELLTAFDTRPPISRNEVE